MYMAVILLMLLIAWIAWKFYEFFYYRSKKFIEVKNRIQTYISDCNELNEHIEELKGMHLGINQLNYGQANFQDTSRYKYRRRELLNQVYAPNVYNCSRTVCSNAKNQPFKYVCKYFNIKTDEDNLSKFEEMLNNFEAAEQGKVALKREKQNIVDSIAKDIPFLIRTFGKNKLERKLGFTEIDFSTMYFPRYIFKYISSGGNASMQCDVVMDIANLNNFVTYLSEVVKFKKSAAGQRALMTSALRREILQRDNYICKKCGASIRNEPNLLLEIDHIVPISKGGLTTKNNLQTLCWRCNRRKGSKIE